MTQNQKPASPSRQDPEQGNEVDPRLKEPVGPGQYPSDIDSPDNPGKKNPGHANPAHNTPGHDRKNQPGQQDPGQPGQGQTQSYPGIKGPKVHALQEDEAMNRKQAKGSVEQGSSSSTFKPQDDTPAKRRKSEG